MTMSVRDVRSDDPPVDRRRERRRELWRFWRRALVVIGLVVLAVALVVWTHWMVQRYLILGDDSARGERFREGLHPTGTHAQREQFVDSQCKIAAEAFYNHGIEGDGDGPAPPEEKAFLHACSGAILGGHGGGSDYGD